MILYDLSNCMAIPIGSDRNTFPPTFTVGPASFGFFGLIELRTISILTCVPLGRGLRVWKKAPPEHILSVSRLSMSLLTFGSWETTSTLAGNLSLKRSSSLRSSIGCLHDGRISRINPPQTELRGFAPIGPSEIKIRFTG